MQLNQYFLPLRKSSLFDHSYECMAKLNIQERKKKKKKHEIPDILLRQSSAVKCAFVRADCWI